MGAESKSLLERWLEAGDAGDVEAFHDFLHDDVIVHAPLGLSSTGIEEEKAVWRAARAIAGLRHDVQEVIVDGDSMAARVIVTGTLVEAFAGVPPSGEAFRLDQVVFAHIRAGKASELWEVADVGVLLRGR